MKILNMLKNIFENIIVKLFKYIDIEKLKNKYINTKITVSDLKNLANKYQVQYKFDFKTEDDILNHIYKCNVLLYIYDCCISYFEKLGYEFKYHKLSSGIFRIKIYPDSMEVCIYSCFDDPDKFRDRLKEYTDLLTKLYNRYSTEIELDKSLYKELLNSIEDYEYSSYMNK